MEKGNSTSMIIRLCVLSVFVLMSGCVSNDGSIRWVDGTIMQSDEDETKRKQGILLHANSAKDFPDSMEGGVVFDGVVFSIDIKQSGVLAATLDIEKVLFGQLKNKNRITIYTPSIDKGGIEFQEGGRYRVYTLYLNDRYRTWASAGTVKIEE